MKSRHVEACMEDRQVSAVTWARAEHRVEARKVRMICVRRDVVYWLAYRCVADNRWDSQAMDETTPCRRAERVIGTCMCMAVCMRDVHGSRRGCAGTTGLS
jgi:hypothetical protein